jgi:hypothetical protein
MLLFLARKGRTVPPRERPNLPVPLVIFLAAARVERPGLVVLGAVKSRPSLVGRQLRVAVRTEFRSRDVAMLDAARLAMHVLEAGAIGYDRFLVQIDQGDNVTSIVPISPSR